MAYVRRSFKTPEEKMEDFIWLVNEAPHIMPKRIGRVRELCPAILYSDDDDRPQNLYLGSPDAILSAFPHEGIAEGEIPESYRRVSAVVILTKSGIHLAVDSDKATKRGKLETIRADVGHEFDEVFTGGFTEYSDQGVDTRTLCTTGLIRQASKFSRLAEINRLDREQTKLALGLCISSLANGMPMLEMDAIEMARFGED